VTAYRRTNALGISANLLYGCERFILQKADTRTAYPSDHHLGRTSHDYEAGTTPVRRLWDVSTHVVGMERRPRALRSYVS
jgi:hypothetical protein